MKKHRYWFLVGLILVCLSVILICLFSVKMNYIHNNQIVSDGNQIYISFNQASHRYINQQKKNHVYQLINPVSLKKETCFLSYLKSENNYYFYYVNIDTGSELISGQYNVNFIFQNVTFFEYLIYFK